MDIVTPSVVKAINGITGTGSDSQIVTLTPLVTEMALDWCKNHFMDDPRVYVVSDAIYFDATSKEIRSTSVDFAAEGFLAGHTVRVRGSIAADGYYLVSSVTALSGGLSTIVLNSKEVLSDSAASPQTVVGRAIIPAGFKVVLARAIAAHLRSAQSFDVKSERIGDYSITYDSAEERSNLFRSLGFGQYRKLAW